MGKKLGFILGAGVGYLLGSKAGRQRYEQIKNVAGKIRNSSLVGKPLDNAAEKVSDAVRRGGEAVTDKVADAVKERLFGASPRPSSRTEYVDVEIIDERDVESTGR